jgi:hypothetical protein
MKSREYGEMKIKRMELTYQKHGLPFKATVISVRHNEEEMTWHILYVL